MAGEMFQGPAQQWRFADGRWQPAAPQLNAQEAPQQMKFHGGACCCWDWLGFSFFNLSRLVLRSPPSMCKSGARLVLRSPPMCKSGHRLVARSPPGMCQSGARLVLRSPPGMCKSRAIQPTAVSESATTAESQTGCASAPHIIPFSVWWAEFGP